MGVAGYPEICQSNGFCPMLIYFSWHFFLCCFQHFLVACFSMSLCAKKHNFLRVVLMLYLSDVQRLLGSSQNFALSLTKSRILPPIQWMYCLQMVLPCHLDRLDIVNVYTQSDFFGWDRNGKLLHGATYDPVDDYLVKFFTANAQHTRHMTSVKEKKHNSCVTCVAE